MRFVLFAADEVGAEVTRLLCDSGTELVCLVVDRKNPRGFNNAIKSAYGEGPVLTSDDLSEPEGLHFLAATAPDLGLAAWWPYILKPEVFEIPRRGVLNLHPSLLPAGRGRNPNFWALVDGTDFGVTIHHIDSGVDTGDIAWQKRLPVTWEDTGGTLHQRAKREIIDLLRERLSSIRSGELPRLKQSGPATSHLGSDLDQASRIDLESTYTGRELLNLLRARTYPPNPGAWFIEEGRRYEVRIEIEEMVNE